MDVLMPQLGETVAEGKITQWFKSAGDPIKPGDNLFEIETDKVSMEVPSTTAGVLAEIRVPAGAVAPVGAVVAVISDTMGAATGVHHSAQPAPASPVAAVPPSPLLARMSGMASFAATPLAPHPAPTVKLDPFFEVRTPARNYGPARLLGGTAITPLARRLASEAGLELSHVKGSGPHGRIVARDVEAARAIGARAAPAAAAAPGMAADEIKSSYRDVPFEELPIGAMRATIARRLVAAKQTIPHFYLMSDVAIGRLLDLREAANCAAPKDAAGNPAFKLSINDVLIKAWAAALARVPDANAVWAADRILRFKHCDIGIAVAVEGGLIAPVVRRAETKSLSAISREMKDLAARARARKLDPSDYQGGSSTISNLGMHGVREFCAIINPPQSTVLAIGAVRRQAVEDADAGVSFTSIMTATLSCDHRVVDGVVGAELLAAFKSIVEQPITMLI
jgi:pyruvate dehydrogenase E2 component (dihydrolipoyllysine-residue acetyltransferase)